MAVICSIYRSSKKEGMYIYTEKKEGIDRIPDGLLKQFGTPVYAMTLLIDSERKLARVDAKKVLEGIKSEGYFLQLPPQPDKQMSEVHQHNSKM